MAPLTLKLSEAMRLRRIAKLAKYKEDFDNRGGQLVVPLPKGSEPSAYLVHFLDELIPAEA